jgi:hypothetical protein
MKNRILIITLALLPFSAAFAQRYVPSEAKAYQSLTDEVFLMSFFVDTEKDYWEDAERDAYVHRLQESQTWLVGQAANYGQELYFNNDYFFRNNEIVYAEEVVRGKSYRTLELVLQNMNYRSLEDYLSANNFDAKINKLKVILFVKSNDRSHAYNFWSNDKIDVAIVYCRSTYGFPTSHYVISHEILHQFGAWDLYFGESQSEEKAEKALALYPHSIMINTYRNLSQLEVDELTAWRVGWHNDFKEEYNDFIPVRVEKPQARPKTTITIPLGKRKKRENNDGG